MEELIGIYKGLRLPLLGVVLLLMMWYVYRPSKRRELEQPRFDMLEDELDPDLGQKLAQAEKEKHA